ncbi:unnamed protein product [Candidula unifasciata]|uniref:Uncharacterized protein n=1 Tax=Candidula unifasciata TaxID=100452 RepID=A0A8S3Z0K3_9EUPU|nr:unnamed protein product [Candidula unifasciata]
MIVLIIVVNVAYSLQAGLVVGQGFTSCEYNYNCTANTNLGVINLNGANAADPYQTSDPVSKAEYFWKPCTDFTVSGVTAGALQQSPGASIQDIGMHAQAFCDVLDGYIRFNMMSSTFTRFTYVKCVCGAASTFIFDNEYSSNDFNFIFTSNHCCPNYSPPGVRVTVTVSPGTVLVIIFFTGIIAYFLFGTIFQIVLRKAEGRERIPNVSFWSDLPGLVMAGFKFTFTCGHKLGYREI